MELILPQECFVATLLQAITNFYCTEIEKALSKQRLVPLFEGIIPPGTVTEGGCTSGEMEKFSKRRA